MKMIGPFRWPAGLSAASPPQDSRLPACRGCAHPAERWPSRRTSAGSSLSSRRAPRTPAALCVPEAQPVADKWGPRPQANGIWQTNQVPAVSHLRESARSGLFGHWLQRRFCFRFSTILELVRIVQDGSFEKAVGERCQNQRNQQGQQGDTDIGKRAHFTGGVSDQSMTQTVDDFVKHVEAIRALTKPHQRLKSKHAPDERLCVRE